MLKIGSVRWRGKCSRHPSFDPYTDGPGAIEARCQRCAALIEINALHERMLMLMRNFAPPQSSKTRQAKLSELQETLF